MLATPRSLNLQASGRVSSAGARQGRHAAGTGTCEAVGGAPARIVRVVAARRLEGLQRALPVALPVAADPLLPVVLRRVVGIVSRVRRRARVGVERRSVVIIVVPVLVVDVLGMHAGHNERGGGDEQCELHAGAALPGPADAESSVSGRREKAELTLRR